MSEARGTVADTSAGDGMAFRQIGKSVVRTDVPGKVHGKTPYAGDYTMTDMLHAKVLRSPLPSARLTRLDVSRARALPGVAAVLTYGDLSKGTVATDIPGQTGFKRLNTDQQILVDRIVRYQGEPIALVAAETLSIAQEAMDLIEFDLEPLEGVYDPFAALEPDAPKVFGADNIVARYKIRKGDIEAGFAAADVVVENTFRTQYIEHAFLEPEVGLGWVDDQGVINIRSSTQCVEHYRYVAEAMGLPHSKVRIRGALVGGGFGGKSDVTVELYIALLTKATGRPVRLCYTREDSLYGHGKRHPFTITHRTGFARDGRITASKIDITSESGPYAFMSPYVLMYATEAGPGPYRVDNVHVDSRSVATNNMYTSAFRGFGATQACIAYEQQMDEAARVLGIDRLELRRRNFLKTGDPIATGFQVRSAVWTDQCMEKAWEALGERAPDQGPVRIGRGVAAYQQGYGRLIWLHDTAEGWVGIETDGTVVVRSGITDIGAGQGSALAQIASELLGVDMKNITVYNSDSSTTPLAGTSTATRGLYMSGSAVRLAAGAVRNRLLERAGRQFGVEAGRVDIADSRVFVTGDAARSMDLRELVRICASEGIHRSELAIFRAPFGDWLDPETGQGQVHPDYTYGAHAVEVAVDTETGEVTILKSIGAHDVGRAVNRAAVEGQIEGGVAQGHGYALSEELIYKDGKLKTPSLSEYLCPTAMDTCRIQAIVLESGTGLGPFGAKGIGEPGHTPACAAVANAVADAIGVRVFDLPITPEKVVKALAAAGRQPGSAA
ncbi:MAG: xanthine dehydrogenase family protein molybdopterin-binding subunit [Burkholderiaceae bacterium]|nr:xanthine dehydrogenase family protein molybdopterin-binding subunit [Burkholderiaceae bacterium]